MKIRRRIMAAMAMLAGMLWAGMAMAGDLTPPGAPASTMHTLTEIYDAVDGLQQQVTDMQQKLDTIKQRQGAFGYADTIGGMVLIPAGPFQMGDVFAEGEPDEFPVHAVTVSAFHMDQYPVTKALWDEVREWGLDNEYEDLPEAGGKGPSHPVHSVSWYDAVKWCNARSEMEGLSPEYRYVEGPIVQVYRSGDRDDVFLSWVGDGYRLPTEAEWEKAARGGAKGRRFPWADANTITHARANYHANPGFYDYDVSPTSGYHPDYSGGSEPHTSPVGSFAPNGYGLYDMAGNVWEWCWDWYSEIYYSDSPDHDPRGPAATTNRVMRGGAWDFSFAERARCAYRGQAAPAVPTTSIGFRCVRSP